MIKIALSHDIDRVHKTHQYATKSLKYLIKLNLDGFINQLKSFAIKNPYWTFDKFIEIEEKYGVRSTVFFLNESIQLNPLKLKSYKLALGRYKIKDPKIIDMIRWLDNNHWEIGVHGSYNSFADIKLLAEEKKTLESILGHSINGIRQHYLNLNDTTWQLQNEVGFQYDSSWGFTNDIGFKEGRFQPFRPFEDNFKVIPLTIMDTCFMSKENKWLEYEKLLDQCEDNGAVMVINFHQHVFSKLDFPGFTDAYIELIERAKARGGEFFTLSQIYEMDSQNV